MTTTPPRLIKIGSNGKKLGPIAKAWPAVLDKQTGRMWVVKPIRVDNWKPETVAKIEKKIAALRVGGFKDWRIPTVDELFTLADRTRKTSPAINVDFFPDCPADWFWTSTSYAPSPGDYAWGVSFYSGGAYWPNRSYSGFVRAVRASQS